MAGIVSERRDQSTSGGFERERERCYISRVFRVLAVIVVVLACGCAREPTDETPEGALELFLEAMGRAADDPSARAAAYALVAPETQRKLSERARLASSLSSRRFEPWEMIAEGRYRLRFTPLEVGGFSARVSGDRAIVLVRGERSSDRAEVPMVRSAGRWRVFLSIPPGPVARPSSRPPETPRATISP